MKTITTANGLEILLDDDFEVPEGAWVGVFNPKKISKVRCFRPYIQFRDRTATALGRYILGLSKGPKRRDSDRIVVDHINGNQLDNRRENLRTCPQWLNAINRTDRKKESYPGVRKMNGGKWCGHVRINNKILRTKRFLTEEEAIIAVKEIRKSIGREIPEDFSF